MISLPLNRRFGLHFVPSEPQFLSPFPKSSSNFLLCRVGLVKRGGLERWSGRVNARNVMTNLFWVIGINSLALAVHCRWRPSTSFGARVEPMIKSGAAVVKGHRGYARATIFATDQKYAKDNNLVVRVVGSVLADVDRTGVSEGC